MSLDSTANKRINHSNIVNYGQMVDALDFNNRFTYNGTATTPPCSLIVYWNVLSKVYPIK